MSASAVPNAVGGGDQPGLAGLAGDLRDAARRSVVAADGAWLQQPASCHGASLDRAPCTLAPRERRDRDGRARAGAAQRRRPCLQRGGARSWSSIRRVVDGARGTPVRADPRRRRQHRRHAAAARRARRRPTTRVRVVTLSRNFGHQAAITAGLDHARGDATVMIDADLQDPPEVIREMVDALARRAPTSPTACARERAGETRFKLVTARWFYRLIHACRRCRSSATPATSACSTATRSTRSTRCASATASCAG